MNYLEITNLALLELNFKTVENFSQLVKPDHKRLLSIINRVNNIILDSAPWQFLVRTLDISLPADSSSIDLPEAAQILEIYVDSKPFFYTDEIAKYLNNCGFANEYTIYGQKILFKPYSQDRNVKIIYITKNHAKNSENQEISQLESSDDSTLMPDEYAQNILVFGACLQFKSNPEHPRYKYWLAQYTDARSEMRASSLYSPPKQPKFKLPRWASSGYDRYR